MSREIKLTYYAKVSPEEGGYVVTFRDLPNVFTEGDTLEEALFNAQEALDGILSEMTKDDQDIPFPSEALEEEYPVPVSPDTAAPLLLHMLRRQRSQTMAAVAKAMNIPYQQYQRLEHNSNMTLKSLKRAASALGSHVEIRLYVND